MSGQNVHVPIPQEIDGLLKLTRSLYQGSGGSTLQFYEGDFKHRIISQQPVSLAGGGGTVTLWGEAIPPHMAILLTAINIKSLPDITDPLFAGNDWRSMIDFHPYSPGSNGALQISVNGMPKFDLAPDIAVMNRCVLFVLNGETWTLTIQVANLLGKNINVALAINSYLVPDYIGGILSRAETTVLTQVLTL